MTTEAEQLAKVFEPILIFHPEEQFFPIDPKWYLERCALWRADPPYDDKKNWGEPPRTLFPRAPQLAADTIAALKTEETGGRTWIGDDPSFGVANAPTPGNVPPPGTDHFLSFAGWIGGSSEVTATSDNHLAALNQQDYVVPLSGSQPWYYVEYLDNQALKLFTAVPGRKPNGLDLFFGVANNDNLGLPKALLYHFFYPVHLEPLEGCEKAGEGATFASFGGEWGCVAVLVDNANAPLFIGLSSRNVGDPSITTGADEVRVGMSVVSWTQPFATQPGTIDTVDYHPKIFVSKGTHGHYLAETGSDGRPVVEHPVQPFSPGVDRSSLSCGRVEFLDNAVAGETLAVLGQRNDPASVWWLLKTVSIILIPWALIETQEPFGQPDVPASPKPPVDQIGGPNFGIILQPAGLSVPVPEAATAAQVIDWNVRDFTAPEPDGRAYGFVVDRSIPPSGPQLPVQPWWVPRFESAGFSGRWGPLVQNDPNSRRAGMKSPDFLELFLEAITRQLNM